MNRYIKKKIYIEESKHDKFVELKTESGIFSSMKDVFMAAASLGFNKGGYERINSKRDIFDKDVFDEHDISLLYAIAIAHKEDFKIETDPLVLVEEYANTGIDELYVLVNNGADGLVNIVEEVLIKFS